MFPRSSSWSRPRRRNCRRDNRIARRGIAVDTVRSAAEAAEKLHPLSRVLMLADGLTTTPPVIATMAREGGDALLVVEEDVGEGAFERVGGGMAWAGIARLDPRRIAELAALPRDYDMEATLVRLAAQSHATHVRLSADALVQGTASIIGASFSSSGGVAYSARRSLPARPGSIGRSSLHSRGCWCRSRSRVRSPQWRSASAARRSRCAGLRCYGSGIVRSARRWRSWRRWCARSGAKLAALRDESGQQRWLEWAVLGFPTVAILFDGRAVAVTHADGVPQGRSPSLLPSRPRLPSARRRSNDRYGRARRPPILAVATVGAVVGAPTAGLALAALLATLTLIDQIEQLRRHA